MRKLIVVLMTFGLMAAATGVAFAAFSSNGSGLAKVTASTLQGPTGGNTSGPTSSSLTISWIAPASGPAPTGYKVVRNGTTNTCASSLTSTATSCTDTGLSASTTYNYEIFSRIANNWLSAGKATASGTTSAAAGLDHFVVTAPASATAGTAFTVSITAQDVSNATVTGYTGAKCVTFTNPSNAPNGTAPTYPAAGTCSAGQSSVTFSAGVGSASVTLVKAETTTVKVTDVLTSKFGTSANVVVGTSGTNSLSFINCSINGATAGACTGAQALGNSPGSVTFNVQAVDSFNNPVTSGATVTLTKSGANPGNFSISGSANIGAGSSQSGTVTVQHTANGTDTATINAAATGFTGASLDVKK